MTPQQFIAKWQRVTLGERSACQQHFLDLCELLGQPKPAGIRVQAASNSRVRIAIDHCNLLMSAFFGAKRCLAISSNCRYYLTERNGTKRGQSAPLPRNNAKDVVR